MTRVARALLPLAGLLPIAIFWLGLRDWSDSLAFLRYAQFSIGLHLLVAFLPFVRAGTIQGFWQYNRILFLRFLLATLYSLVLFAGLAIALLALDNLFGVNVRGNAYENLFLALAFVFHPWFFLAGVPRDLAALDALEEYPVGLKVFAQFVLIPLVTVYLLILTAYLVRVLVTTTWPSGWIGWLVSSVAAAGTLALLLVHPIRKRADSRWVDVYGRWFYVALLPSIGMLIMAVWLRIDQYGFTERRYLLLLLTLWLTGIALFYALTGSRNIKAIPWTLCLIALGTIAGPWSAYAVSLSSQVGRFERILERNDMIVDGRLRPAPQGVSIEDRRELSAILRYLVQTHGASSLARIDPTLADTSGLLAYDPNRPPIDEPRAHHVMERLGLDYVNQWETPSRSVYFYHQVQQRGGPIDITGFTLIVPADLHTRTAIAVAADSLVFEPIERSPVRVSWQGRTVEIASIEDVLNRLSSPDYQPGGIPQSAMMLEGSVDGLRLRILFKSLAGQREADGIIVNTALADILIGEQSAERVP